MSLLTLMSENAARMRYNYIAKLPEDGERELIEPNAHPFARNKKPVEVYPNDRQDDR